MARVRMTMDDIKVGAVGDVDHAALHRTTEADIRRRMGKSRTKPASRAGP